MQSVAVLHRTSRAGDPHRHIHFQIGTRVRPAGRWRTLDTAALFKQQGAIRALGTAVIAAHPKLAAVLDAHDLTLDPATGEVAELEPYNALMSKRAAQVERNLAAFTADWEDAHPGQTPWPAVRARLHAKAWDHQRPNKKPTTLGSEEGWRRELDDAGYTPNLPRARDATRWGLDELRVQQVASRALDRCASGASEWTVHTVTEHVTRIITEHGVTASADELRDLITLATGMAVEDCLSILPPGVAAPEHVAHLTSLRVVAAEAELRDLLTTRAEAPMQDAPGWASSLPNAVWTPIRNARHRCRLDAAARRGRRCCGCRQGDHAWCCHRSVDTTGACNTDRDADQEGRRRRHPRTRCSR